MSGIAGLRLRRLARIIFPAKCVSRVNSFLPREISSLRVAQRLTFARHVCARSNSPRGRLFRRSRRLVLCLRRKKGDASQERRERKGRGSEKKVWGGREKERERQTDRIERKRERRKETVLESKRSFPWFRAFGASLHSHVISFYHYQCSTKLLRGALAPDRRSEISGVGKRLAD